MHVTSNFSRFYSPHHVSHLDKKKQVQEHYKSFQVTNPLTFWKLKHCQCRLVEYGTCGTNIS